MDVENREWEVVIIGAGMGGGTVGHALVSQGHSVLFVERGAKDFEPRPAAPLVDSDNPEERIRNGHWPSKITTIRDGVTSRFFAPLGCGVGGSTLLYVAALERFYRSDFLPAGEGQYGGSHVADRLRRFLALLRKGGAIVSGSRDLRSLEQGRRTRPFGPGAFERIRREPGGVVRQGGTASVSNASRHQRRPELRSLPWTGLP